MGTKTASLDNAVSAWPHRLAVVLCCATFPLVWVGGLVTTTQAGMAFPDWPTSAGYFLFFYPWLDWLSGPWDLFVEHGHRLIASIVGLLTIAFCASTWLTNQPRWLRVLGAIAVIGVVLQGVLGGMRVLLDERVLAMFHGCVGPAFFAFTAVLAVVTSRRWRESAQAVDIGPSSGLRTMAVITPALAYLQLAIGAHVRHFAPDGWPATFHFFIMSHVAVAFALAIQIFATAVLFWRKAPHVKPLVMMGTALAMLVVLQILLGAATWVFKYGWPAFAADTAAAQNFTVQANGWRQMQITTAHVAMGSLILAVSTSLAVLSMRMIKSEPKHAAGAASTTTLSGMAV